jgi:predicted nuclease with TOPRIM domain
MAGYSKVEDLIKNREDLCEEWTNYTGDQKDVQAKLKTLQQKLQAPDISEEEVAKINKEVLFCIFSLKV